LVTISWALRRFADKKVITIAVEAMKSSLLNFILASSFGSKLSTGLKTQAESYGVGFLPLFNQHRYFNVWCELV